MRDYGKISPQFWTGETGRAIRKAGRDAQVVAIYLISCPSSNMIGLYYLPLPTLCHEVGLTTEGASKALRSLFEAQFASWDAPSEHVFVVEMAAHQIGQRLERGDKRVKAVIREWQAMRKSPFYRDFWTRYSTAFHLPEPSPFDAPSMPLRSQEHEHEHEHEQEQEQEQEKKIAARKRASVFVPPSVADVAAYCLERDNAIDAEAFVAHYSANGWKIGGRTAMKDWKSAVITWEKRDRNGTANGSKQAELFSAGNPDPRGNMAVAAAYLARKEAERAN